MALNNFTPAFSHEELKDVLRQKMMIIRQALINEMEYAGEQGVSEARDPEDEEKNYTDRTSNLRKSIGYFIFDNNLVVRGNFEEDEVLGGGRFSRGKPNKRDQKKKRSGSATTGANVGKQKARVIANESPTGLTFVMVAGMIYGVWVEARGYNVLTPASQIAETNIKKQFARLVNRINRKVK